MLHRTPQGAHLIQSDDKYYYFYTLSQHLCLLFLSIHSALAVIYNTIDVPVLAIISALSIGVYFIALKLNMKRRYALAWILVNIEMIFYAAVSSYCLGDTGIRDMLMFLPMVFFLYPVSFKKRLAYVTSIAIFYACLAAGEITHAPVYALDQNIFNALNIAMDATLIFVLSYFTFYTYRAVTHKEESYKADNKVLHEKYLEMEKMSMTDILTGLYNRQKISQVLSYEIERAFRYDKNFSVILLDIDHFKSINDTYGHKTGDRVLIAFAEILSDTVRKVDVVGRWGGEEFMIISPETDAKGAAILAEKLRAAIEKNSFLEVNRVTASFGVGSYVRGLTSDRFVELVDQSLYQSKSDGRNRVTVCKELELPKNIRALH